MRTYAGQSNTFTLSMLKRADADPITSGTVNMYLVALSGTNAGKWYKGATTSWETGEQIAGAAAHKADGAWSVTLPAGVWTFGDKYRLYAKESNDLHIPHGVDLDCEILPQGAGAITDSFTISVEGDPVPGADVWISTDEAGDEPVAGVAQTNAQGEISFSLDIAEGYWVHVQKSGFNFTAYPKTFNCTAGGFAWA